MDEDSTAGAAVRVFLLDDHEVVRRGLRDLLEQDGDIEVVGEAGRADEALKFAASERDLGQRLADRVLHAVDEPVIAALMLGKAAQATDEALAQKHGHICIAGGAALDARTTLVHSSEKRFLFFGGN